ncbi:MAG: ParB N-terminal domain-containing protein [Thermoguttaceae bacterium]|nr:ParB N-terminal domain-containing protein [Thermoguttaceae bacterium]
MSKKLGLLEIVDIPIAKIIPFWNNPRKNHRTIKVVEKSIQEFGFNQPLVVIEIEDEQYEIVVGHTRFFAMKNLGYNESIPCRIIHLTAEEAHKYRLADNAIKENTQWDEAKLLEEIRSIIGKDVLQNFLLDDIESMLQYDSIQEERGSFDDMGVDFMESMESEDQYSDSMLPKPRTDALSTIRSEETQVPQAKGFRCPDCGCLIEGI